MFHKRIVFVSCLVEGNLNNKGRLDGDIIWGNGRTLCVWVLTLDLRNGVTYEYEICTVNSCDDTLKSDGLFF